MRSVKARIFYELQSRDREDGCATGQPQGVGPEAYLNGRSQGSTPEDARKDWHIRGRSRRFMKYPGYSQNRRETQDISRQRNQPWSQKIADTKV